MNRSLFIETNLGNRIKTWSINNLFGGDKSKATNINDLRHMYINNFFKKERIVGERIMLSNAMAHSIKTQAYYKKDKVSEENNNEPISI